MSKSLLTVLLGAPAAISLAAVAISLWPIPKPDSPSAEAAVETAANGPLPEMPRPASAELPERAKFDLEPAGKAGVQARLQPLVAERASLAAPAGARAAAGGIPIGIRTVPEAPSATAISPHASPVSAASAASPEPEGPGLSAPRVAPGTLAATRGGTAVAALPVALVASPPEGEVTAQQQAELDKLGDDFVAAVGGPHQNPADPQYASRWQQAQETSDRLFQLRFGQQAFVRQQVSAAQHAGQPGY